MLLFNIIQGKLDTPCGMFIINRKVMFELNILTKINTFRSDCGMDHCLLSSIFSAASCRSGIKSATIRRSDRVYDFT